MYSKKPNYYKVLDLSGILNMKKLNLIKQLDFNLHSQENLLDLLLKI